MPVKDFVIKQGDRRPYLYATLGPLDEDGEIIGQDLTGATVTFNMRRKTTDGTLGALIIDSGAVVVDDVDAGEVHYPWQVGDTDEPGEYVGEFIALYGSEEETFPNNRLGFTIKITASIA